MLGHRTDPVIVVCVVVNKCKKLLSTMCQWMILLLLVPVTLPLFVVAFVQFYRDELKRRRA